MSATEIRRHNEAVLRDLEKGDMVEFPRGIYSHWAVYIGNEEVVHLAGDPDASSKVNSNSSHIFSISGVEFDKALVKRENFFKVAGDSKARKNNDKDQRAIASDKETIVERALSKLGEIGYNVLWNNCEYFASWCRYGHGWSEQTIKVLIAAGLIVSVTKQILRSAFGSEKKRIDGSYKDVLGRSQTEGKLTKASPAFCLDKLLAITSTALDRLLLVRDISNNVVTFFMQIFFKMPSTLLH